MEELTPTPTNIPPSYSPPQAATPTPTSTSPTRTPTSTSTPTPTMTPSPIPTASATPLAYVAKTPQGPSGLEGIIAQLDSLQAANILDNVSPRTAASILSRMPAERLAEVARWMDEDRLIQRLDRIFAVVDLAVSPSEAHPGDEVTVTVSVTNTSSNASVYPAILRIDDTIEQTQTVEVGAGQTRRVTFTLTNTEGNYGISLHGLSHRLTVVPPAATPVTAATPPIATSTATPTRTPMPASTMTLSPTATPVPIRRPPTPSVVSPTSTVTSTPSAEVSATATAATVTPIPTANATALPTRLPTGTPIPTPAATPIPALVDEGESGPPIIIILVLIGFAGIGLAVSLYLGQRG